MAGISHVRYMLTKIKNNRHYQFSLRPIISTTNTLPAESWPCSFYSLFCAINPSFSTLEENKNYSRTNKPKDSICTKGIYISNSSIDAELKAGSYSGNRDAARCRLSFMFLDQSVLVKTCAWQVLRWELTDAAGDMWGWEAHYAEPRCWGINTQQHVYSKTDTEDRKMGKQRRRR